MVKVLSLKKRYIAFELRGKEMNEKELKHAIYTEALTFFGEYGLSYAALKLIEYNPVTKRGILRCERDYKDKVLGFLALSEIRLVALKSSGTLKSLESTLSSIH
ncbi:Rpp14/Pop5 family protein [Candidatus Micrarchaeota archaeon]|nr:Rpp14/Pop5 family protein [Candidatus Micrarchaeota archaeon]